MTAAKSGQRAAAAVDGLLLLNKPAGLTSNQALQKVKRALQARKAGHTGSLDPAATGMLPLCFGEATKVCAYLLAADKTYRVTARLGEATDTGDADGKVIATAAVPPLDPAGWEAVLQRFLGETEQVPPMYSALKHEGRRLYELARKGQVVERPPRPIRIDALELLEVSGTRLALTVHCSKGTYIRTLVEDIAAAAGTVAYTASLHRETVGDFNAADMLDLPTVLELASDAPEALRRRLLPADRALAGWPEQTIPAALGERFRHGQSVPVAGQQQGLVRVYAADGGFLGVGELAAGGTLTPRRIFHQAP